MRRILAVLLFLFILTAFNGNHVVVASCGDSDGVGGSPGDGGDVGGLRHANDKWGRRESPTEGTSALRCTTAYRASGEGDNVGGITLLTWRLAFLQFVQR